MSFARVDVDGFTNAVRQANAAIQRFGVLFNDPDWNRHHPSPLKVNGHAYRRRQRARARRNR